MLDNDLKLISGNFRELILPKEKRYVYKYFKTKLHREILAYYLAFGDFKYFRQHTGLRISVAVLDRIKNKYVMLEKDSADAKEKGDFIAIAQIESGRWRRK